MIPYTLLLLVLLALCCIALSESTPKTNLLSKLTDSYNSEKCEDCVCGIKRHPRIVGGSLIDRRSHPWIVRIRKDGESRCGGSLITGRHILTAAHCVNNRSASRTSVHVGHRQPGIRYITRHPDYNRTTNNNDIAIVELYKPVKISSTTNTICLPKLNAEFDGKTGVAVGYGVTHEANFSTRKLRAVELPILSKSECHKSDYSWKRITDNMICAGFVIDGGKDTCKGDSGGPLEVHDGRSTVLAGIVSWGAGCAREGYPSIFTKVSKYIEWIQTHTSDECLCR